MTQDFAKKVRTPPHEAGNPPRWVWFASGFLSGAFIAFLTALWFLVPVDESTIAAKPTPNAEPNTSVEEMQWDFYEIFPKSVVPVVEEYNTTGEKMVVDQYHWILQAGSFKNPDDADERRARLLLMGLAAMTTKAQMSGTTWHRVIVGPFATALERNRAQDRLAQAQIKSIPIKIPRS